MLKFMTSVWCPPPNSAELPGILAKCKPALAPPNGWVLVKGWKAPPLSEMEKAEDGTLSPAPSVNAAVELVK
jgi:hypothetical protein